MLQPGDRVIYYGINGDQQATYIGPKSRSYSDVHVDGEPFDKLTMVRTDALSIVREPAPAGHFGLNDIEAGLNDIEAILRNEEALRIRQRYLPDDAEAQDDVNF